MTDGRDVPPLSEDDIAAIAKRAADEAARILKQTGIIPYPAPPSGTMTGSDLLSLKEFSPDINALERMLSMMLHGKLSGFITREQALDLLSNKTSPFLNKQEIRDVFHEEIENDATIRAAKLLIRGAAAFFRFAGGVGKKVGFALAVYLVWAFLKWAGLKDLPSPPGIWE